jgi:general stress protein YciG
MATQQATQETRSRTSNRGFASMDAQKQREIASKGGKAAHESGNAHEFTSEDARAAGRKGGQASHANRQASQKQNRDLAANENEGQPTRSGTSEIHTETERAETGH